MLKHLHIIKTIQHDNSQPYQLKGKFNKNKNENIKIKVYKQLCESLIKIPE